MAPLKICLYTPNYPGVSGEGGIGTYTRHLARALASLGHEPHVLTPGTVRELVRDGPVTIHLAPASYFPVLDRLIPGVGACCRIAAVMRQIVIRHEVEVVEFPNWGGLGLAYGVGRPAPMVVRLHTSALECSLIDGEDSSRLVAWDIRRERWLNRAADTLVTHSLAHRSRMAEELGVNEDRIHVVPHGIEVYPAFRRILRSDNELRVVYLGRMEKRKGTIDLLNAIPDVLREVPEARFILIGSDRPHCPGGRTHAQYLEDEFPAEVRRRISLAGRLSDDEVDSQLQEADLLVAPSLYESFGLIFLEAMRWGTAVIGTTAGGIPEIVEHEKTGLLVEAGHPSQLAQAMITLLHNKDLRHRLGDAGRRRVESIFNVDRMARQSVELYETALGTKQCRIH
ncbi:glycosyltransferase family 4 protein [Singulisphaera sp. Ch08]|uniref:Glycosyltransferase family 4 protein n=1 Tax=Singulisphaera sp. Ch08 TaxID=3120278 RepID=A0AAU7CT75_9BACT